MGWCVVILLFITMFTFLKGQAVPLPGDKIGCAYIFNNNTYFVSPTSNIIRNTPYTIMFWLFPSFTPSHKVPEITDDTPEAEIFNTGDFQDAMCSCSRRIVFLYSYANASLITQVWTANSEGWGSNLTIVSEDIQLAQWYHIAFFTQYNQVIVNGTGYTGINYTIAQNLFSTSSVDYAYVGKNYRGKLDEVRIYPYNALHKSINANNSWAYQSVCSDNIIPGSLDFYLNFDECGGNSIHNTGKIGSPACWQCFNMDGSLCAYGANSNAWGLTIIVTRNCTFVPSQCIKHKTSWFGIPISTLVVLIISFLVTLLVCVGIAACLGRRHRNQMHGYGSINVPPHLPPDSLATPPLPPPVSSADMANLYNGLLSTVFAGYPPTAASSIINSSPSFEHPYREIGSDNGPTITNASTHISTTSPSSTSSSSSPSSPSSSSSSTSPPISPSAPKRPIPRTTVVAGIIASNLIAGRSPILPSKNESYPPQNNINTQNINNLDTTDGNNNHNPTAATP